MSGPGAFRDPERVAAERVASLQSAAEALEAAIGELVSRRRRLQRTVDRRVCVSEVLMTVLGFVIGLAAIMIPVFIALSGAIYRYHSCWPLP